MNGHQFKALVGDKYDVEVIFWAPEAALDRFRNSGFCKKGDAYQIALMVLCENEHAFRSRLAGTLKDEWLSTKTFGPIVGQLILAMEDTVKLSDMYPGDEHLIMAEWQVELLALLRTF
jgi:hypothetical protein